MQTPIPVTRELILVGGGHCHALVLRMWGMDPLPGVRVTVINPAPTAPYSGMLPGYVAGHYRRDELDIELVRLARFAGARLIRARATQIDTEAQTITLNNGRVLSYDIAALDIGVTSEMPALKGFAENAVPAKPLDGFARAWSKFRVRDFTQSPPRIAIIGGGIAGVELALAMSHSFAGATSGAAEITLIDRQRILPGLAQSRLNFFRRQLGKANVQIREDVRIKVIGKDKITFEDGPPVNADFIVGAAGARAQPWLADSGLTLHEGYVSVDETLRSLDVRTVFAVGDCAHLSHAPRPKAGVYAVREAPVLFANLRAALSGGELQAFQPQSDYLKLISLGRRSALADKWGMMFRGAPMWRLKNRIDRKFMDQFADLKPMTTPLPSGAVADGVAEILDAQPLCGGCGAKIGGLTLQATLDTLPTGKRDDVLRGPGDDAATLAGPGGSFQVISCDHLRAFTNDPDLMARIAAVHALGDIWAMAATPQSALASITLPRLGTGLQQSWLAEIMTAATEVFAAQGATIIGGHSASGAELSIGFTVTGLRDTQPVGKSGARPGDALILTKPLGTGVILAGEMAMRARGDWVMAAFDSMVRDQGKVAQLLAGAHAMTDVTGFGLAGHMGEIAHASGVGFELKLADIPILNGAAELAHDGVRSSIYADNRALSNGLTVTDDPGAQLLFDPQTAGGLLAALPPKKAATALKKINALGFDAKIIGHCHEAQTGCHIV